MEEIAKILSNYGFAVAVAGYLLIKLQPTIEEFTKKLIIFENKLDDCMGKVEEIKACVEKEKRKK